MYQYLNPNGQMPPTPSSGGVGTIRYTTPAPVGILPGAQVMPSTVPVTAYQGPTPLLAQFGPTSVQPPYLAQCTRY